MRISASVRRRSLGALTALTAAIGVLTPVAAPSAHADVTTISIDPARTGWDTAEPALAPSQVSSPDFGQRWSAAVDGQVYAQPLVIGQTVVVATENDTAYGLDRATGAIRWSRSFGPAWPASAIGCGDLTPNIGVSGAPAYDAATGTVYLIAKVNDGSTTGHPHFYLHAMDAQSGAERTGFPVPIQGDATNAPTEAFNPFTSNQRTGLLLMNGEIFAGFGSHCDIGPYNGWLAGISTTTGTVRLWTSEKTSDNGAAGIWQGAGGIMSDGPGRVFLTTGNGLTPPIGPGSSNPATKSESVIRLGVNSDGSVGTRDFFAPCNAPTLDAHDTDLGSGGPVALPAGTFGTAAHPDLLVEIGKDGRLFVLDRNSLGGRCQGANGTDADVSMTTANGGVWGHPAVWGGDGGYVYTVANGKPLEAFRYGVNSAGRPALTAAGTSAGTFPFSSGSPIVTSTGTTPGSALVWVVYSSGGSGTGAQLRAYDAKPAGGALALRWSAPIGTASKFTVPATDGGQVFVGTRDGHVIAFGRPAGLVATPVSLSFGQVTAGSSGTLTATIGNNGTSTETVTGTADATAPFTTSGLPAAGAQLAPGASLTVSVTFAPTAAGNYSSSFAVTGTDGTTSSTATVRLTGSSVNGTVPAPAASTWTLNGSATPTSSGVLLTPATVGVAGSAFYDTAVPSAAVHARFTATIGGGTGADGMTFTMLDASKETPKALGGTGQGLGYSGLSGVAVALITYAHTGYPSSNFVAVVNGVTGTGALNLVATSTAIGSLRTGSHTVDVAETTAGHLTVAVDGAQVIDVAVALPPQVLVGFTGATGGATDNHTASAVSITY